MNDRLQSSLASSGPIAAAVLTGTALVYALLVGALGVAFHVTPLVVGLGAVAAGLASGRPRLLTIGVAVAGWGVAVALVREGVVPNAREAAAFLVGAAVGLLIAAVISRRYGLSMVGPVVSVLVGGVAFYLAFDVELVDDWPFWTGALLVWAIAELLRPEPKSS
jgi:hypothetical protein